MINPLLIELTDIYITMEDDLKASPELLDRMQTCIDEVEVLLQKKGE